DYSRQNRRRSIVRHAHFGYCGSVRRVFAGLRILGRQGGAMTAPLAAPPTPLRPNAARNAPILLLPTNLFNYIDRQVLAAVETNIEETYFPEKEFPRDPVTNERVDPTIEARMGSLNLAFMVAYMVIAPLFGFLADRTSRWLLIGIGVVLWSL